MWRRLLIAKAVPRPSSKHPLGSPGYDQDGAAHAIQHVVTRHIPTLREVTALLAFGGVEYYATPVEAAMATMPAGITHTSSSSLSGALNRHTPTLSDGGRSTSSIQPVQLLSTA
jgi:hypothetical protein